MQTSNGNVVHDNALGFNGGKALVADPVMIVLAPFIRQPFKPQIAVCQRSLAIAYLAPPAFVADRNRLCAVLALLMICAEITHR